MKPLALRALALAFGSLAGATVAEGLLRLVPERPAPRSTAIPVQRAPRPRFFAAPLPRIPPKAPTSFRVLALGDSFTWGAGVRAEDAWPMRLDRHLRLRSLGLDIQVVNGGRPGWNTVSEQRALCEDYLDADPDLVVLGICLNDPEPSGRERRGDSKDLERREPAGRVGALLAGRSALYRLVFERLENRRQRRAFDAHYRRLFANNAPGWAPFERALGWIRDDLRARGVPLLAVVFPVFDSRLDQHYPYRDHHARIATLLEILDIPAIDLLDEFQGMDASRLAVDPFVDPHPNEIAHRIAAERIEDELYLKQLLPLPRPWRRIEGFVPPPAR